MIVGTWNLENLFRSGQADGPSTEEAYDTKLEALRRVIDGLHPDVLAVQEVGNLDALEDLRTRLAGTWHTARLRASRPARHPRRLPVAARADRRRAGAPVPGAAAAGAGQRRRRHGDRRWAAARCGCAYARPARAVDLVTCHLKSKLLTFPGAALQPARRGRARPLRLLRPVPALRRSDDGAGLRDVAARRPRPGARRDRARRPQRRAGGRRRARRCSDRRAPSSAPRGSSSPTRATPRGSGTSPPCIPEERRFSRVYRGRGELIDHILVSHLLVHRVETVDTGPGEAPSITDDPHERRDEPGSDHLPVVARFDLS